MCSSSRLRGSALRELYRQRRWPRYGALVMALVAVPTGLVMGAVRCWALIGALRPALAAHGGRWLWMALAAAAAAAHVRLGLSARVPLSAVGVCVAGAGALDLALSCARWALHGRLPLILGGLVVLVAERAARRRLQEWPAFSTARLEALRAAEVEGCQREFGVRKAAVQGRMDRIRATMRAFKPPKTGESDGAKCCVM